MKPELFHTLRKRFLVLAFTLGFVLLLSSRAQSQTFSVVHSFAGGDDGANPLAGLVIDGSGNLYGTTSSGGANGAGSVFEYSSSGEESVLYNFTGGNDGGDPEASLLLIGSTLYGTTVSGGTSGSGTVFEVTLQGKETVLYSFKGQPDGAAPGASLVRDSSGNFYSTTNLGGANGNGTVFKLIRSKVPGAAWTEQVLYSFGTGTDGANPVSGVSLDSAGNLYGTTSAGGTYGYGTVFQLAPSGTSWTENTLHEFELLNDGGIPYAGIVLDHAGNLYGATTDGGAGGSEGGGTIFEMTSTDGVWSFSVLYSLPGWGISGSFRNLLLTSNKIYATTHCDGANSAGTVYELTRSRTGTWSYVSLYVFTGGTDGLFSFSNLVLDKTGDLYGTTKQGGAIGNGVLFKVHP
jgi:uncharacterized repeat protein (TIGR03803 family)